MSGITTRTEIPVFIEKPFHTDLELDSEQETSSSTTLPTSTSSRSSTGSTSTSSSAPTNGSVETVVIPENGTVVGADGNHGEQELLEDRYIYIFKFKMLPPLSTIAVKAGILPTKD
jgi:hypothetical protein